MSLSGPRYFQNSADFPEGPKPNGPEASEEFLEDALALLCTDPETMSIESGWTAKISRMNN